MSSALYSSLATIQQDDYGTLALLTVVGYDYILMLPGEIEYIWNKRWTWVSMLFVIARYFGLCNLVIDSLYGSTFLDATTMILKYMNSCEISFLIGLWAYPLFLGASDLIMILRIWAMYNRSKLILITLLALFSIETISVVVAGAIYSQPAVGQASVVEVQGYSFCSGRHKQPVSGELGCVLQITFGATLCTLAIVQSVRESLQMYRATRQWHLNRYFKLMASQGILYFFALFLLNLVRLLEDLEKIPKPGTGWPSTAATITAYLPLYALTPRFIISIRKLYARDIQRGGGIDTGFGLSTLSATAEALTEDGMTSEAGENVEEIVNNVEV